MGLATKTCGKGIRNQGPQGDLMYELVARGLVTKTRSAIFCMSAWVLSY